MCKMDAAEASQHHSFGAGLDPLMTSNMCSLSWNGLLVSGTQRLEEGTIEGSTLRNKSSEAVPECAFRSGGRVRD